MLEDKIVEWVTPKLDEESLYLVDIKCLPSNKIQVFIDGDKNVTIEHCARVSRYLESYLDEADGVPSNYNLEVSSPGMDRPLKVPRQYLKRIGRDLDIVTKDGETLKGKLLKADSVMIRIEKYFNKKQESTSAEDSQVEIPYTEIKKAVVQFDFNKKQR